MALGQAPHIPLHGKSNNGISRWPVGADNIQYFIIGEGKGNVDTVSLQMIWDGWHYNVRVCREVLVDGQHDTARSSHRARAKTL